MHVLTLPPGPVTALPGFEPVAKVGRRMTLDAEGRLKGVSGKTYPYREGFVAPVITDTETERFRKRWIGRRVFPYGGRELRAQLAARASFGLSASPVRGMVVVDLVRVRRKSTFLTYHNGGLGEDGVWVDDFWLMRCRPDRRAEITGGSGDFDFSKAYPNPATLVWTTEFVNAEHLERALSLVPPRRAVQWALAGGVQPGQTPETVAWILGWPPIPGTRASLSRLSFWDYPSLAPFGSSVTFRNGKVVRYDPPGMLP